MLFHSPEQPLQACWRVFLAHWECENRMIIHVFPTFIHVSAASSLWFNNSGCQNILLSDMHVYVKATQGECSSKEGKRSFTRIATAEPKPGLWTTTHPVMRSAYIPLRTAESSNGITILIIFGFGYIFFELFYLFLHSVITYTPVYRKFGIAIPIILYNIHINQTSKVNND